MTAWDLDPRPGTVVGALAEWSDGVARELRRVGVSFVDWLRKQTRRRDAIGDLARDTRADLHWPPAGKPSRSRYRGYLVQQGAIQEALDALDAAWGEWDAQRRAGTL